MSELKFVCLTAILKYYFLGCLLWFKHALSVFKPEQSQNFAEGILKPAIELDEVGLQYLGVDSRRLLVVFQSLLGGILGARNRFTFDNSFIFGFNFVCLFKFWLSQYVEIKHTGWLIWIHYYFVLLYLLGFRNGLLFRLTTRCLLFWLLFFIYI